MTRFESVDDTQASSGGDKRVVHPTMPKPGGSSVSRRGSCAPPQQPKKRCSHEGCANQAQAGGVCIRHGAKMKRCSHEGCDKKAQKGGVCIRHGAKVKRCSHDGGCKSNVIQGGFCIRHGARVKRHGCGQDGCANWAVVKGGVCRRHGAKVKCCSHEGCTKFSRGKVGVCWRHGAEERKRCIHEGCAKYAKKGGVCWSHGAKAKRTDAGGDGELFMRRATATASRRSPSLLASVMTTDFSDDDKIGAWVYKYVCPEHQHVGAQQFSKLLQKARDDDLVIDGSRGLFIAAIDESY